MKRAILAALTVLLIFCTPSRAQDQPLIAFATYIDASAFNHPETTFKPMLVLWVRIPILPIGTVQEGRVEVVTSSNATTQTDRFELAGCNRVCSCCLQDAEWWHFTIGPVVGFEPHLTSVKVTYYRSAESTEAVVVGP